MLRLFYNKEKDGREWPWKVFDPSEAKMYKGTHVKIEVPCQTEEKCTVGLCAAYCIYIDNAKVVEQEEGVLSIVEKTG